MAVDRSHFEAALVDSATLDAAAAAGINWGTLLQILLAILEGFGITLPTGATPTQAKAAAVAAGINWGNILQTVLKIIGIIGPILGGLGGAAKP